MTDQAARKEKAGVLQPWMLGWALAVLVLLAGFGAAALNQQFGEPDNAMRLVEVRDFLAGQGWYDTVQHRLSPPDGVLMHWARWVDAAIAAPVWLLSLAIGQTNAEIAVAFLYPFALLAVFVWLASEIAGEIAARDGLRTEGRVAGAVVTALAFPAIEKFAPGSFDHHNVVLVAVFAALLALIRMGERPRLGLVAGAALGFAMGTAAEGVPLVAAGLVVAGLAWLVAPKLYARGLAFMGAGLMGASALSFLLLVPPSRWGEPECDAMSTPFLGFGLAGGAVAIALAFIPAELLKTFWRRFAAAAVLGAVALGALVVLFPGCMGGGYSALGEDMMRLWMAQISESRSLIQLAGDDIALFLGMAGTPLAALVAAVLYLRARRDAAPGWIVLGFLVFAIGVMLWQIRGGAFATALAVPFGGWAIARARQLNRTSPGRWRMPVFMLAVVTSASAAWASTGGWVQKQVAPKGAMASYEFRRASARDCFTPEALAPLAKVEPAVLLNHFSLGPVVLQRTGHSVLAAPYHRNGAGTMAMIEAMRASPGEARRIVAATGATHVLVCPALPEARFYAAHPAPGIAPEATLSAMLLDGAMPPWLAPVDLGRSPLKLYRIVR